MQMFDNEHAELPKHMEQLARIKSIIDNATSEKERHVAREKLAVLEREIQMIESGVREGKYHHQTRNLLKEYMDLMDKPVKVDFMSNTADLANTKKNTLINNYLNIAKKYIHIEIIPLSTNNNKCAECDVYMQYEDDHLLICPMCGFTYKQLATVSNYTENNRINVTQRYVYEKRAHFVDSVKKFQGKQNTTIHDNVYKALRKKIENHGLELSQVTKEHIYEFLSLTSNAGHYEDITLIYYAITGVPPPNISHLEEELYSLFEQIEAIYNRIKPPDRRNFLNGQYVLFKLLEKLNYKCRQEDFYILKTRDKMLEHDQVWKRICDELSWTYKDTV
jgi:stress-induced morphogen